MLFDLTANSNSRKIMVLAPDYPQDITTTVTAGEPASVTFQAIVSEKGRPDEYTYQWYVDGNAVEGATAASYVRDVLADKGQYSVWCDVTNKAGTVRTRNATMTIQKAPVLDAKAPADASVTISKSATFTVSISEAGYPDTYTYQWYVDDKAVEGAKEASYKLTGSEIGTKSVYCQVTNEAGSVKTRTAKFTVTQEYINTDGKFADGGTWAGYISGGQGSVTQGTNALDIFCDGARTARAWSTKKYDFTGKNKLVFYCRSFIASSETDRGTFYFGAGDTQNDDGFVAKTAVTGRNASGYSVVVDVSKLSGSHYLKIAITRTVYHYDRVLVEDVYFE